MKKHPGLTWIIIFGIVVIGSMIFLTVRQKQAPMVSTAQQLADMIEPYSLAYDTSNTKDILLTGEQPAIIEELKKNIEGIAKERTSKCLNAKIAEGIRQYFSASYQLPDKNALEAIKSEATTICGDKFSEVKAETLKKFDGYILPLVVDPSVQGSRVVSNQNSNSPSPSTK
jgi:hypothetical protein